MAIENQNDVPLPGEGPERRRSSDLLPRYFRTTANVNFLQATLDQLIQPGVAEKLNSYFGRKNAKAFTASDNYTGDVSKQREDYQFEPAMVIKDELDNVTFYKDYNDITNQISVFGGDVRNHSSLYSQDYHPWNPHVDWDKFVNFREYYWLPTGPQVVNILGQEQGIQSTYKVSLQDQGDNVSYVFQPDGLTANPKLTLYRGQTYRFEIDTPGHPMAIALSRSFTPGNAVITATREGIRGEGLFGASLYGEAYDVGEFIVLPQEGAIEIGDDENTSQLYPDGITKFDEEGIEIANVYVENGTVEFTIPLNAPDYLFYISKNDLQTSGQIRIYDIEENTAIDVEAEILGKKEYQSSNGIKFTNGLKVQFGGNVVPEKYSKGFYYVEGVGDQIRLIRDRDLILPSAYSSDKPVLFDSEGFDRLPFANQSSYAGEKDYIVVNRASPDKNPWARYNRWFHKDVIQYAAEVNGQLSNIDQSARAKRPIIEFEAGLKLFNSGVFAKADIDLIDDYTKDVFSTIEGQLGYNVDGVELADGMRILFAADEDILVKGKIYEVKYITIGNRRQITLQETEDTLPQDLETVLVTKGNNYAGSLFHYDGTDWKKSQEKTSPNIEPKFDLFDSLGNSYGDNTIYEANNFTGTKLFSYARGQGTDDSELGFPLTYQSIENSGDIVFDFNLLTDSFVYQDEQGLYTVSTDTAFLKKYDFNKSYAYENGWQNKPVKMQQKIIRQYISSIDQNNNFEVDVVNNAANVKDLQVAVYVNKKLQFSFLDYELDRINSRVFVRFYNNLNENDIVELKVKTTETKNNNGHYEFPFNLERNPKNEDITQFTLGEVIDHVDSMIEDIIPFQGSYPGSSNLRDIKNINRFGKRFVKHTAPMNLAGYHITSKEFNVINAIKKSKNDYAKFKRQFLQIAETLGYDGPVRKHVDRILVELNKDKTPTMPYYFSDMIPIGANNIITYEVLDVRNPYYSLTTSYNPDELSNKSVQVYLNGKLLVINDDYTFDENGFVLVEANQKVGDVLEVIEWESTDGAYIPPTPTKLGLYPKYRPQVFKDTTYLEPTNVIQGHDGSIVIAFNDFRDDLLLELERRIFNNIKFQYNTEIFDINDYLPGTYRFTGISLENLNNVLLSDFVEWQQLVDSDYTDNEFYNRENQFTFNYSQMNDPEGELLPGFWRGVYKKAFDTDRPHTHPWEMLGITLKPTWWEDTYGKAPYTLDNLILWEDLSEGLIKEPGNTRRDPKYVRPNLLKNIPVDKDGNLRSPLSSNYAKNYVARNTRNKFAFGDISPTENAWRRSSEYPFALIRALILTKPNEVFGRAYDLSRIVKNIAGQKIYKSTGKFIELDKIVFPNSYGRNTRQITSGLVNYIFNYISANVQAVYSEYQNDILALTNQMGFKISGFSDKAKFKLLLDSRTPYNQGNVFVPEENYQIFFNTSSPIQNQIYSAVTIEKVTSGYRLRGYAFEKPYFSYYEYIESNADNVIVVGGVSETFQRWTPDTRFLEGVVVENAGIYYRTTAAYTSGAIFTLENLAKLPELPTVGGRRATVRKNFRRVEKRINYGTQLRTSQEVVDFLLGYGEYLTDQGFVFDTYNNNAGDIDDWKYSAKEFLFWTTQNWAAGTAISLSPAANVLQFKTDYAVVDNLFDNFYSYSVLDADARQIDKNFDHTIRQQNSFGLILKNTDQGIYQAQLPLVQKEHVCLLDNTTQFGDVIYHPATGYRQERIKVLGYRSDDWHGGLDIPGFVYDNTDITVWESYKDYTIGDLVKHKEFYYVALFNIPGEETFNSNVWQRLAEKPTSQLMVNFDYKINQFADFYDLDSDNFDIGQQKLAQHLIGYQPRNYLANIINDDVSQFKFYQGMIQDKGTLNSLTKLFDALNYADKDSLEFFEEWAIQLSQYGATDNFKDVDFILDEEKFRISPQPIELVDNKNSARIDNVIEIQPFEVYSKADDYNSKIFPSLPDITEYIQSAGYVRTEDIKFRVKDRDELLDITTSQCIIGDYVWVTRDNLSWNVYQLVDTPYNALNVVIEDEGADAIESSASPFARATLSRYVSNDLKVGDVVGIYGAEGFGLDNFCYIAEIDGKDIVLELPEGLEIQDSDEINLLVAKFRSVRVSNTEQLNELIQSYKAPNQKVWIDKLSNSWSVIQNTPNYNEQQVIFNPTTITENYEKYGTSISASADNRNLAVASPDDNDGKVHLYKRTIETNNLVLNQTLVPPDDIRINDAILTLGVSVNVVKGEQIKQGSAIGTVREDSSGNTISLGDVFGVFSTRNGNLIKVNGGIETSLGATTEPVDVTISQRDINFGQNVAMSPDGKFLAVGAPNAEEIKTRFRGEFDPNIEYGKNDVIKFRESLYKTNREIIPATPAISYNTFNSYKDIASAPDADSSIITLLLTGNPGLQNATTDHFLVRAPFQAYLATEPGDQIGLTWNRYTNSNPSLDEYLPWDGDSGDLTYSVITDTHTIVEKIDLVLFVDTFINSPIPGDFITTPTGSGKLYYIETQDDSCVMYLTGVNGVFDTVGTAFVNDRDSMGNYEILADNIVDGLGGFWLFNVYSDDTKTVPLQYLNGSTWIDVGTGLIYNDIKKASDNRQINEYFNLQNTISEIGLYTGQQKQAGQILNLTYWGDNGNLPTKQEFSSDLFAVRMSTLYQSRITDDDGNVLTDPVSGDNIEVRLNLYDLDDYIIDVDTGGFTFEQLNQKHEVVEIWDGYIDFEFTEFDGDDPYEPLVGSIITDIQTPFDEFGGFSLSTRTTSRAEVVRYQRDGFQVRIFLKNISGDWSQLNNIAKYEIRREADPVLFPGEPARVMGRISSVEENIALGTDIIGGLLIFRNADGNLPLRRGAQLLPSWQYSKIVDEEYWFYDEEIKLGADVPANYPDYYNRDYTQIYSIPVDEFGDVKFVNEGLISIFKSNGRSGFRYVNSFVSERAGDNKEYGTKLKLVQDGLDYTLFVSSIEGTGQLEIIKHGVPKDKAENYFGEWGPINQFEAGTIVENDGEYYEARRFVPQEEIPIDVTDTTYWNRISWRYGKDGDYKGLFQNDPILDYSPGEIVKYADPDDDSTLKLYRAITRVDGTQEFDKADWELVTSGEDYLGYLPNDSGTLYENEFVFSPKWPLTRFAKSFDVSKDGKTLVVLNEHKVEVKVKAIDTDNDTIVLADNASTVWMTIGMPIRIRIPDAIDSAAAETQIGLSEGITYYVHSILNDKEFRIATTYFDDAAGGVDPSLNADTPDSSWEYLALDEYSEGFFITDFTISDTITSIGIYKLDDNKYMFKQIIEDTTSKDGIYHDVAISDDGKFLAISEPFNDSVNIDQGRVLVYKENSQGQFADPQILVSPNNEQSEQFGYNIDFSQSELVITSKNGDIVSPTTFDGTSLGNTDPATSFDSGFTTFNNIKLNSGVVFVFENLNNEFVFAERLNYAGETEIFGEVLLINDNHTYVGMPRITKETYEGEILDYRKPFNKSGWNILREPIDYVDISKIEGAFLYNKETNTKLTNLDFVDIIQGKLPGPAEEEIDYKVPWDPARYNVTPLAGMFDETDPWGPRHVGEVWYDISLSKFINAYQGDIIYQTNNFNKLMPGYDVAVYEWVESDFLPSKWDELSGTELGISANISGRTLYADAQYTQVINYDETTQTFGSKFYFWVRNKTDVPNIDGRLLSARDIARLISDPAGAGYRHLAILAQDRFIVHNCDSFLNDKNVVLNVKWNTGNITEQNIHTQYQIMSDGLGTSKLNEEIERKWFDSLIGYDQQDRQVPDPNLPVKLKYGNRFSPRQGMFVNKTEALKQVIERINLVLIEKLIVDDFDLSPLNSSQLKPSRFTNLYDYEIDTLDELRFIGTSKIVQAQLIPVVNNGRITRIEIAEPGRGYKDVNFNPENDTVRKGPTIEILGQGSGAEIQTYINNLGQITNVEVISQGENYTKNTRLIVRRLSVLVNADSSVYGKWSIYDWDNESKDWFRKRVQEFDTTLFWNYADWYAEGYNEFTDINYKLEGTYQLYGLDNNLGDIVKISSVGEGGWLLLRKIDEQDTEDFTINYETIGRQNGTVQFTNSVYDLLNNSIGFDTRSFDSYFYDNQPVKELRIILETVRDNLFVDELEVEYNKLWFASLRYVFSEQPYVDWAFKTSFVKAKHNLGILQQDITFNNDTLPSYEAYIEEAKPFKSSIREFVSDYEALDETQSKITDFDLAPYYDTTKKSITTADVKVKSNIIVTTNDKINELPRRDYRDAIGYEVTDIRIANPGSKFTFTPNVYIEGGGGTGATAKAYLGRGKITKIEVTNPGSGYLSAPTIRIVGSQAEDAETASASVILGNSKIRTANMKVKFDRTSGNMYILDLNSVETFAGTGAKTVYKLEWPIANDNRKIKIFIDGVQALRSEFTYRNEVNFDKGYERTQGVIEFTTPPVLDAVISVEYDKSVDMLHAQDRINFFYKPETGMLGKELGQLMDGIDYGGVQVRSFEFTGPSGWDSDDWYSTTWDSYINTFEDEVFVFDGSTVSIQLSVPLEKDVNYNVYIRLLGETEYTRIDGQTLDSSNTQYDGPWIETLVGDGVTQEIFLDELGISVKDGDSIIIRKETSDGSFEPDELSYDTALSGGDLQYQTAKGIAAEEIIIDGDGFVTPMTSKGPEELVPGQLVDSLDIKVFERETNGQGIIYAQTFILGEDDHEFDLKIIPGGSDSVIVKLDNEILSKDQYNIDWANSKLSFNSPDLIANQVLSIIAVGKGQQNILDTGREIGVQDQSDYLTSIKYQEGMSLFVTLNGVPAEATLIEADDSFPNFGGNTVIRFIADPEEGDIIDYIIFHDNEQINYSQLARSEFKGDGSTATFDMPITPLYQTPPEYKVLVRVGNKILNPGYNAEFTIPASRQRQYQIELFQKPASSIINVENTVKPYINGTPIKFPQQWIFDSANSIIELQPGVGQPGDTLEVYIVGDGEYTIENNQITFVDTPGYDVPIEIMTFTNHNILEGERINYEVTARSTLTTGSKEYTTYHRLTTGEIELRKPVLDAQYVFVSLNGELLVPSLDYYVTDDGSRVRIERKLNQDDVVDVMSFSAPLATERFAFRQFKDMLNRTHFKRIDQSEVELTQNLNYYDLRIEVTNGDSLPEPNKAQNLPGIIWINKERIEYLVKEGNTLRQLRRGTLGTSVNESIAAGTKVYDQGAAKNIPYIDETITKIYTTDGSTKIIDLDFDPSSFAETYNSAHDLEIRPEEFFEVFYEGRRLRKNSITKFNPTLALDSTDGDEILPAEFSVVGNILTINVPNPQTGLYEEGYIPPANKQVFVIRKHGKVWNDPDTPLSKSINNVANFLRSGSIKFIE